MDLARDLKMKFVKRDLLQAMTADKILLLIVTRKAVLCMQSWKAEREEDIACIVKAGRKPVLAINTRLTILLQLRYVGRKP